MIYDHAPLNPTASLLVILPDALEGKPGVAPDTQLLGLALLRRTVLAAVRAGCARILVLNAEADKANRLLAGLPATVLMPTEPLPVLPPARTVLLAAHVLPNSNGLRKLLKAPIEPEQLYCHAGSVAVIETADPRALLLAVLSTGRVLDPCAAGGQRLRSLPLAVMHKDMRVLASLQDVKSVEDWLLKGLIKDSEGFMSRHVERRLSLALTRRLATTRLTPNTMTGVSIGIGLAGAPFFLSATPEYQLTGALLFLAHSILNGCDGELARLKFQESRFGGLLDFWGDNIVHGAVFGCMALGWSLAAQSLWPLLAGGAAVAGAAGAAGFVYWYTLRNKRTNGPLFTSLARAPRSHLSRIMDFLARRDFIYLVVILSVFGKAAWFVALAAVGAPLFFLLLLIMARTDSTNNKEVPDHG